MTLSFFSGRKRAAQTPPHVEPACVGVNVTVTEREAGNDGLDWNPDPQLAARIRADLPNAPSPNLIAARHAAVLDQEAAFLTDRKGNVPPPDEADLIAALRFAAEHIRDGIVIA